jgi:hypothetical protein
MSKHQFVLDEIDLVYRPVRTISKRPSITSPETAHQLFRENWKLVKRYIFLDRIPAQL